MKAFVLLLLCNGDQMAFFVEHEQYVRSISESTAVCEISNDDLGGVLSKGLQACWEEELFLDVDIVTMEGRVMKCHKIVLASVSPFFKAALSPKHQRYASEQDRLQLTSIPYDIMKLITEFVYKRSIEFPKKDLQELIMAANFLQLESLEKKCADLIHQNTDEANILEVTRFAKQFGIIPLTELCKSFIESHFSEILHSNLIFEFSVDELEEILKDFHIVISDTHGVVAPISIQEKKIFETVIKFIDHKFSEEDKQCEALDKLQKHIRFADISEYEYQSLLEYTQTMRDVKLATRCKNVLDQSRPSVNERSQQEVAGSLQRSMIPFVPYKSPKLARGHEAILIEKFDDSVPGKEVYVKGMKIWTQLWESSPVLGAMEVLYSDGSTKFHGKRSNHEVYEFLLAEDEFIVKVIANSGFMIDKLEFVTNTGKSYGPYGGDGGTRRILEHPNGDGYFSYISGTELLEQRSLGIGSLSFHFGYLPRPGDENSKPSKRLHSDYGCGDDVNDYEVDESSLTL